MGLVGGRCDDLPAPPDLGQIGSIQVGEAAFFHRLPLQRPPWGHHQVHQIFPELLFELTESPPADRQEEWGKENQEDQSGQGQGQAHPGDLKHPDGGHSLGLQEAGYHDGGGGSDDGHHSAEDGGEGEGHEIVGGALPPPLGPGFDLRGHHGHDGGIVEEGRGSGHREEEASQRPSIRLLTLLPPPAPQENFQEGLEPSRLLHGPGHHEEGGHGEGRWIGKAGEGLRRGHHPHAQE